MSDLRGILLHRQGKRLQWRRLEQYRNSWCFKKVKNEPSAIIFCKLYTDAQE